MTRWYLFILLVFIGNTSGINVGVGISDITGPAAEVGMVSTIKAEYKIVVNCGTISDGVCQARPEYRGHSY